MHDSALATLGTLAWGIDGLLGMLLLAALGLVLIATGSAMLRNDRDARATGLQRLIHRWRGVLPTLAGLFAFVLGAGNSWGTSHVHRVQLTLATKNVHTGNDPTYVVEDTSGREFTADESLWHKLAHGDRLTCSATSPLFIIVAKLVDCERRPHSSPHGRQSRSR